LQFGRVEVGEPDFDLSRSRRDTKGVAVSDISDGTGKGGALPGKRSLAGIGQSYVGKRDGRDEENARHSQPQEGLAKLLGDILWRDCLAHPTLVQIVQIGRLGWLGWIVTGVCGLKAQETSASRILG